MDRALCAARPVHGVGAVGFDETDHPYDRYAEAYRDWWAPVIRPSALQLLDQLGEEPEETRPFHLLDVGTGTGALALAALARWPGVTVTGVDPSGRMLELAMAEARRNGSDAAGRLSFLVASADRLPLQDETVDAAVSSFVIQLVPSRAAALREVARVLRPGGTFACVTWQAESAAFEPDDQFVDALDELDIETPPIGRDARPYTSPRAAAAELRRAGFQQVQASVEWLEHRYNPESYLDTLEHWIDSDLFDSLGAVTRYRLRRRTLRKLRALPSEAFVWRRPLISVLGCRRLVASSPSD